MSVLNKKKEIKKNRTASSREEKTDIKKTELLAVLFFFNFFLFLSSLIRTARSSDLFNVCLLSFLLLAVLPF